MNELKKQILSSGAVDVSFGKADYKNLQYVISFCVKLSDFVIEEIVSSPTYTYFHHYRTANALIDRITFLTGNAIEERGYQYFPVPASQTVNGHDSYKGVYSHKKAAVLAGLGSIGKNGLFLHKEHGAKVRLGTVFTNMPLEVETFSYQDVCGQCSQCAKACPAQAIYNKNFDAKNPDMDLIDRRACSDYMKKQFQHIGRGAVCGICISQCRYTP